MNKRISLLFLAILVSPAAVFTFQAQAGPVVYEPNGGWCWYQDERVLYYDNKLIIGSVGNAAGFDGINRAGDIQVTTYDLTAEVSLGTFVLHDNLQPDDHDLPAFLLRPDGKFLAVYSKHGERNIRYRISTNPGDATAWEPEQIYVPGASATYSNLFHLSAEGKTYDFYRGENYNPNFLVSTDQGSSWSYGGRLVNIGTGSTRPYVKYASNNVDEIHFVYTEGHPSSHPTPTNIHCAYIKEGNIYRTDGTLIKSLADGGIAPDQGSLVYPGTENGRAWTTDLHLDAAGRPFMGFSVHKSDDDHRYYYARWDGTQWQTHEMAYAGQRLYVGQNDYTGLIALNPSDPNTLYISTNADPVTGNPLISSADGDRHWEVFRGFTNDGGASWNWTPVTANSATDNLRPIVPIRDAQNTSLLWLEGTYTSYTNYNQRIVGYDLHGANGSWLSAAGGSWAAAGNWNEGMVPFGKFSLADFSALDIAGDAAIALDGDRTIGFLVFGDKNPISAGSWSLNPGTGGAILLESLDAAMPSIKVRDQSAAINVPLRGNQGLMVEGPGMLILGAANFYSGDTVVGSGTLKIGHAAALSAGSNAGTLTVNGTLDMNGYDVAVRGLNGSGAITNGAAASRMLTVGNNDASGIFFGTIHDGAGTVALTKIGTGNQTLAANQDYTGPTVVNGGKLIVEGALATGSLIVNNGAAVELNLNASSVLSLPAVTFGDGATSFDLAAHRNRLNVTNANGLLVQGTTTINISSIESMVQCTLIDYEGSIGGNGFGGFSLGSLPPTVEAQLVHNTANGSIDLRITSWFFADYLKWTADAGGDWDVDLAANFKRMADGAAVKFQNGNKVYFGDTAAGDVTVNLTTAVSPGHVFISSENDYLFTGSGKIGGAAGLEKSGKGVAILATNNDFAGPVTIREGTLQLGAGGSAGSVGSGSILNDGTLTIHRTGSVLLSNSISGAGALNLLGSVQLTLSGNNSYIGDTRLSRGTSSAYTTLVLDSNSGHAVGGDLVYLGGYAAVKLNRGEENGGTPQFGPQSVVRFSASEGYQYFDLQGHTVTLEGMETSEGSGSDSNLAVQNEDPGQANSVGVLIFESARDHAVRGIFRDKKSAGGKLALIKRGPGAMTLLGASSGAYTGGLRVENGLLDYRQGALPNCDYAISGGILDIGALSKAIGAFQITGGAVTGTGTLASNADYDIQAGNVSVNLAGNVGLVKTTDGVATLSGTLSYSGSTVVSGGTLIVPQGLAGNSPLVVVAGNAALQTPSIRANTLQIGGIVPLAAASPGEHDAENSASSIPEPSMWILLLTALLVTGVAAKRRR